MTAGDREDTEDLSAVASIQGPMIAGAVIIVLFLLIFVGWGATAPIAGGAAAAGAVSPEGSRKVVQHLEGGIIDQILVRDGDVVAKGDPLIILRNTQAEASHGVLLSEKLLAEAEKARLQAEHDDLDEPVYPAALVDRAQSEDGVRTLLNSQTDLFRNRQDLHQNRRTQLSKEIAQLRAEISGLQSQIADQNRQLELISSEKALIERMVERGLATKQQLLTLQRDEAAIQERRSSNRSGIARAEQAVGRAEAQLQALESERRDQIAADSAQVFASLAQLDEKLPASADVLERTVVAAPISGVIVNLRFATPGGVIGSGEPILDIVPLEDDLVVVAELSILDVDSIAVGQKSLVDFPSLPKRSMGRIDGEVTHVSADVIANPTTGQPFYEVRVSIRREGLPLQGQELVAGMPANILIVTRERTMMSYLFTPWLDTLRTALREE